MFLNKLICSNVLFLSLLLMNAPLWAAPEAKVWAYWQDVTAKSPLVVDHSVWDGFLTRYLIAPDAQNETARVDYAKVSKNDKTALKSYIASLENIDPKTLNKNAQMAYWINLYNAATVDLILDNYPIKSITKLGGFMSFGPWDKKILAINNKTLSLNDIEHRILRPIWQDKRIHYAVNCASLSCPNLMNKAFTAQNLSALLAVSEAQFIQSRKAVHLNKKGVLVLSEIYRWYAVDFGSEQQLRRYLAAHVNNPTLANKLKDNSVKLTYAYDWRLNDAGKR